MEQITTNMLLTEILEKDSGSGIAEILMRAGMRCPTCPSVRGKTLEQAGSGHGVDPNMLAEEINSYLQTV